MIDIDDRRANLLWLRGQWLVAAAVSGGCLLLGRHLSAGPWTPESADRWTLAAAAVLSYQLALLWVTLDHNHGHDEDGASPFLGVGNLLTLIRGLLVALVAGFLVAPHPAGDLAWVPGGLYIAAILIDYADGAIARRLDQTTALGETLDMEFDALGILIGSLLGLRYGQLPWWYLSVGVARYLFVGGVRLRRLRGRPVYALPTSAIRRPLAGLQMAVIGIVLVPVLAPPVTTLLVTVAMLPFLGGFIRDWLAVSGRIETARDRDDQRRRAF